MQLHIGSKHYVAEVAVALDVTGREHLVVVAKATWSIPEPGQRPRPLPPLPLAMVDDYYGDAGESAMRYGSDFARFKPRCDVIFDACAHAPDAAEVQQLNAGWQVGALHKKVRVFGPRSWETKAGPAKIGAPAPFKSVALHYGNAFGGSVRHSHGSGNDLLADVFLPNPIGKGFVGPHTRNLAAGLPASQLEAPHDALASPEGPHLPWAFSAIPANCPPRIQYAGSYDSTWEAHVAPFLPEDFDERFHQVAPPDQQMPYPTEAMPVMLENLIAGRPRVSFTLPNLRALRVMVLRTDYSVEEIQAPVDTIFFETEAGRFSAVWRASVALRRRLQEIDTVALGQVDGAWWRARRLGLEQEGGCEGCGDGLPAPMLDPEAFA
ncbi:DUF2169 family type VI secretion system accessory protein [Roseateles chitinivorans]|uniref:DUF2169 family type VI secretion system accessory protein n=1 Tax=Roseateles chitinivorans TaxID=2917965 RepID=UPI003D66E837